MGHSTRVDNLAAQRLLAGHTVTGLAKKANVSDWIIRNAEAGGGIEHGEAQRLADALGISTVTLGKKDL